MTTLATILCSLAALAGAVCEPTPRARTPRQFWAAIRRTHWTRLTACLIWAAIGTLIAIAYAVLRGCGWGIGLALTALICQITSLLAMDGRRLRLYRTAGVRI